LSSYSSTVPRVETGDHFITFLDQDHGALQRFVRNPDAPRSSETCHLLRRALTVMRRSIWVDAPSCKVDAGMEPTVPIHTAPAGPAIAR